MIIDAHAHIFPTVAGITRRGPTRSQTYGRILWGNDTHRLLPPTSADTSFPPEMLLQHMDSAGVAKAVLMQGSFYGTPNDYVAQAVRRWPDRFTGAAYIDPRALDAHQTFARCMDEYGFRLLKFEMSVDYGFTGRYPDLKLDSPEMAWIWAAAAERNLTVALDLGNVGTLAYQTTEVERIIARHPMLKIVICHLATPPVGSGDDQRLDALWQAQIRLGKAPRVWFDLSALPAFCARFEDYPYPTAQRYVKRAIEMIGTDKLMWGTDAPSVLFHANYQHLLRWVAEHCTFLTGPARAKVLGETALRVYFGG